MPNPPNPWDRLDTEGEGSRAYSAFCLYRDLASDRSIYKTGQKYARLRTKRGRSVGAKPHANFERWSVRYDWVNRARQWDDHLLQQARSSREEVILAELKDLKVDQLALANKRIRFELRGHDATEAFFSGLEAKFQDLLKLPSTGIKQQKLNEAGDVTELREIDGLRPTELTRVVKQAMDTLAQGVHGNKKVTQTERVSPGSKAGDDDGREPVPMQLVWGAWPGEDVDANSSSGSNE